MFTVLTLKLVGATVLAILVVALLPDRLFKGESMKNISAWAFGAALVAVWLAGFKHGWVHQAMGGILIMLLIPLPFWIINGGGDE